MEFNQVIDIINAVSDSKLSGFEFRQDDTYIKIKKQCEKVVARELPVQVTETVEVISHETDEDTKIEGTVIKSPIVGTFYAASSPDAEPFVKVGERVQKGQVIGIIEAMKLMNEIESEYDGTIQKILVNNKEMVEYGQPLFVIKEN